MSAEHPLVSVIVPVRNGAEDIAECLRSVLDQTYKPLEVIVVDGQSTDETTRIAQSFDGVRVILEQEDPHIATARNLGIKSAKGAFIAIISADDTWAPDKIEIQVKALLGNPGASYCVCRVRNVLADGESAPSGLRPELLETEPVGHMPETLLARAELFDRVGLFDRSAGLAEDVEWFARVRDAGEEVCIIDQALLFKRVRADSLSYRSPEALRDVAAMLFRRRGRTDTAE